LSTLRDICDAVQIPVVAIGGIGEKEVPHLAGTGISGVAVVSALFAAPDVEEAARTLRATVDECL
jgi:thiamine-phosphate pyrophosphorylase